MSWGVNWKASVGLLGVGIKYLAVTMVVPIATGLVYGDAFVPYILPFFVTAGLAVGLAFFPDLRGVITSIPVVGGLLPAADPLYLTSFGGAFVVSTTASLVAARLADAEFDLGRLSREIRRFDDGRTDAPSSD
mgnify:CR=1 FL=1